MKGHIIPSGRLLTVYNQLPSGRDKTVTAAEISQITGIPVRRVYECINTLIMQYDIPIAGARRDDHHGYYIITNEDERQAALIPLIHQQTETAKRIEKLNIMALNYTEE